MKKEEDREMMWRVNRTVCSGMAKQVDLCRRKMNHFKDKRET